MIVSSNTTGSPASLALRLTRGLLWSTLMGAAVLGMWLAAAVLTRDAGAHGRVLSPLAQRTDGNPSTPGDPSYMASAWEARASEAEESYQGLPSPIIIDVVPLAAQNDRVSMRGEP